MYYETVVSTDGILIGHTATQKLISKGIYLKSKLATTHTTLYCSTVLDCVLTNYLMMIFVLKEHFIGAFSGKRNSRHNLRSLYFNKFKQFDSNRDHKLVSTKYVKKKFNFVRWSFHNHFHRSLKRIYIYWYRIFRNYYSISDEVSWQ